MPVNTVQPQTTADKLYTIADELQSLSRLLEDAAQLHTDEIVALEAKLEDVENQRDEAQALIEGHQDLKDAVYEFFDRLESPAPEIRDRALDGLREVYNRVNR